MQRKIERVLQSEIMSVYLTLSKLQFYDRFGESVFRRNIYHRQINIVKMQINIAVGMTPGRQLKSIRGDGYCTWLSGHLPITDD